jgi:hypothetical protein
MSFRTSFLPLDVCQNSTYCMPVIWWTALTGRFDSRFPTVFYSIIQKLKNRDCCCLGHLWSYPAIGKQTKKRTPELFTSTTVWFLWQCLFDTTVMVNVIFGVRIEISPFYQLSFLHCVEANSLFL